MAAKGIRIVISFPGISLFGKSARNVAAIWWKRLRKQQNTGSYAPIKSVGIQGKCGKSRKIILQKSDRFLSLPFSHELCSQKKADCVIMKAESIGTEPIK